MSGLRAVVALCGIFALLAPREVGAQSGPAAPSVDSTALFGARDWALVGGLIAAQVAVYPFDDDVRSATGRMRSGATDDIASMLRPLGRPQEWFLASAAAYGLGHALERRRLADVGLHAALSLVLANAVTGTLKGVGGRSRPFILEVQGTDSVWAYHGPREWDLFRGFSAGGSRQSYPSGHTTAAFTMATVLAEELGGAAPWIAYPVAAGVAWSRLNDGAHWASDVAMGALVGIVAGRLVVRHGHRPGGWLERTLLFEPSAAPGGFAVGLRIPMGGRPRSASQPS